MSQTDGKRVRSPRVSKGDARVRLALGVRQSFGKEFLRHEWLRKWLSLTIELLTLRQLVSAAPRTCYFDRIIHE